MSVKQLSRVTAFMLLIATCVLAMFVTELFKIPVIPVIIKLIPPSPKSVTAHNTSYLYQNASCTRDVLSQITRGKWQKRDNLTTQDWIDREEKDKAIRRYRSLPVVLYRDDKQCGNKFPLGNSGLPSLCDPNSSAPCCNQEIGWCGSGEENCTCQNCTDFRTIISAELYKYVPSSGCKFKNFTSQEACAFMNRSISNLVIAGDSLMRHFSNAVMIILTDDPREGALKKELSEDERKKCAGDYQFVDSGKTTCHGKTVHQFSNLPEHKLCKGRFNFTVSFAEGYSLQHSDVTKTAVRENLNKSNSVIAIGVGLHDSLNHHVIIQQYLQPILRMKKDANSKWPYIIWVTVHAQGSLKPLAFTKDQNNHAIFHYNQKMKEFLKPLGIPVFDVFNLTLQVRSYDGTHFGIGVSMMKAQLLLNFLEEKFGQINQM